jgi:hypothetical protein
MSVGTPVLNYGARGVAPTQKDNPLLLSKGKPHLQPQKRSGNEKKLIMGSDGDRSQGLARVSSILLDLNMNLEPVLVRPASPPICVGTHPQ